MNNYEHFITQQFSNSTHLTPILAARLFLVAARLNRKLNRYAHTSFDPFDLIHFPALLFSLILYFHSVVTNKRNFFSFVH